MLVHFRELNFFSFSSIWSQINEFGIANSFPPLILTIYVHLYHKARFTKRERERDRGAEATIDEEYGLEEIPDAATGIPRPPSGTTVERRGTWDARTASAPLAALRREARQAEVDAAGPRAGEGQGGRNPTPAEKRVGGIGGSGEAAEMNGGH